MTTPPAGRDVWQAYEPYHAICYFAPEPREAPAELGLRGFWMGYFAGRAAPMGAVGAGVVTATFFGFHPAMVERAIPDAWAIAPPDAVLETKLLAVERALERLLDLDDPRVGEAAVLATAAAAACDLGARPLGAAWASTDVPGSPLLELWRGVTVLREHRGDGHLVALAAHEVGPCEAHVLVAATGASTREVTQPARGWSDDDWVGAEERLRVRGWLDDGGRLTQRGRDANRAIGTDTDHLAAAPWRALGAERTRRFIELVEPLSRVIAAEMWFPNPMGLPRPE